MISLDVFAIVIFALLFLGYFYLLNRKKPEPLGFKLELYEADIEIHINLDLHITYKLEVILL